MSGGGIGSALGTALGAALAPETGGASLMLIPALGGAVGGGLGAALTGGNVLRSALGGGVSGAFPGFAGMTGLSGALASPLGEAGANGIISGLGGALGSGIAGGSLKDALVGGVLTGLGGYASTPGTGLGGDSNIDEFGDLGDFGEPSMDSLGQGMADDIGIGGNSVGGESTSLLGKFGDYAMKNPLELAILGNAALTGAQGLMGGQGVNVGQNQANVLAANPGFNGSLPKYTMHNTATPYTGDWYKYGYTPQTAQYNAMPVRQYAHGGRVQGYADGGMPMAQNPLELKKIHDIGKVIGQSLKGGNRTPLGLVSGEGDGQDDLVPAKLSVSEYIIPAEVVSQLGNGSSEAGGRVLDKFITEIREHKTAKRGGFPHKAKNPLDYLPKEARA